MPPSEQPTEAPLIAHVRRRPGMYIGSQGPSGLSFLLLEVVSNTFDHVITGRATRLEVDFDPNGSATVTDDGPGIDVTANESGMAFLEEVFTTVRSTPTADGHTPHVHLGLGAGLGPVSAVCSSVVVETTTDGIRYRQRFSEGHAVSALERLGWAGDVTGTTIQLVPDTAIFGDSTWDVAAITERLRTLAWLAPGLNLVIDGEAFGPVDDLTALIEEIRPRFPFVHGNPFLLSGSNATSSASVGLGWKEPGVAPEFRSFCNFREMTEGGTHILGVEEGLRLVLGAAPMVELMRGLVGVVHVTMLDPAIGGPTRGRLDDPEAIWLVADAIAEHLPAQLERHPEFAETLRQRVPRRPG